MSMMNNLSASSNTFPVTLTDDTKKSIIQELNSKIGGDITNLVNAFDIENELVLRRNHLQNCLSVVSSEVPSKLSNAIKKAEKNSDQVKLIIEKSDKLKKKTDCFLAKTKPLRNILFSRFHAIHKLESVLKYLKSFEQVEEISQQMQKSSDDEQKVLLYGELKTMCSLYTTGHRAIYIKECTHYWHIILKENLIKQYEDVLKSMKWPIVTGTDAYNPSKETLSKFTNLTKYLFLIEEPNEIKSTPVIEDLDREQDPCLPIKILLRPLKKRFAFHFTGTRQTARIDRPEWFFTQTLTWIKDHNNFINNNVQPVADKLQIRGVKAVDEFNTGLIALAAERLHTVLGLYNAQGAKGEILDVDAAFAHAVDETLGFQRELCTLTGKEVNSILSVLTKAETFVKWLAVEKKYALLKLDETLGNEQWMEAVAAGVSAAVGAVIWVPRGADWFISLLKTIEDRYTILPQPGHRLQFLELQLELVEEWRVRLSQLLSAALDELTAETFLSADDSPHALTAVVNAVHHTRAVLLQWAHSLHYLQLHYYRRQFEEFTQQHHSDAEFQDSYMSTIEPPPKTKTEYLLIEDLDNSMSLIEVEVRANKMALNDVARRDSVLPPGLEQLIPLSPFSQMDTSDLPPYNENDDSGVFSEALSLLAHLRDAGLSSLADHVVMEFKAGLREYKKQKWHAMLLIEEMALSVSPSLCRPLAGLCARLHAINAKMAPSLCAKLRTHVAAEIDVYMFQEVILESWWNTGGTAQFSHDVKRNLIPVFATSGKKAIHCLPRLLEACKILNMDYDDAWRLKTTLTKIPGNASDALMNQNIRHVTPNEAIQILSQRTDIGESSPPQSVMELF